MSEFIRVGSDIVNRDELVYLSIEYATIKMWTKSDSANPYNASFETEEDAQREFLRLAEQLSRP